MLFAGPVRGRKLAADAVKTVSTVITSNPAIKKVGEETIAFASAADGKRLRFVTAEPHPCLCLAPFLACLGR